MGRPRNSSKKGRFSNSELNMVRGVDESISPEKAAERLAPIMLRSESAIRDAIVKARQELQSQASDYVKLHRKAAEVAAEMGNSKPAEWMLDRLEQDGQRVVPAQTKESAGGVKIILANVRIGGTRDKEQDIEVIDAE